MLQLGFSSLRPRHSTEILGEDFLLLIPDVQSSSATDDARDSYRERASKSNRHKRPLGINIDEERVSKKASEKIVAPVVSVETWTIVPNISHTCKK